MATQKTTWKFEMFDGISSTVKTISSNMKGLAGVAVKVDGYLQDLGSRMIRFNALSDAFGKLRDTMQDIAAPGAEFQQQIADLQAITGIAGQDLEVLSKAAREVGKSSGLGASQAVEAFKLLASNIDISVIGGVDGLKLLQKETISLSQAAGVDLSTAANTMASTINQFGYSANEASRVINVLAAGAKFGAAEIPDLADSLKNAGTTAAAAGLQIEDTVAALEVLSQNAIKGGEAGTGLRNVLLSLQTKGIKGVDLKADGLFKTLEKLAPKLNDATFLAETFGKENINAAQVLIKNNALLSEMTDRVTGSSVAYEQATIRTQTYQGEMMRIKATFDDFKISVFNATGSLLPYLEITATGLQELSRTLPALTLLGDGVKGIYNNWSKIAEGMQNGFGTIIKWTRLVFTSGVTAIKAGWKYVASGRLNRFFMNSFRYGFATIAKWTRMIFLAGKTSIKAGYDFIRSGGLTKIFAKVFSVAMYQTVIPSIVAFSRAILAIPGIGWILGIVGALITLGVYLYDNWDDLEAPLMGYWESFKEVFMKMGELATDIFGGIRLLMMGALRLDGTLIDVGLNRIESAWTKYKWQVKLAYYRGASGEEEEQPVSNYTPGQANRFMPNVLQKNEPLFPGGGVMLAGVGKKKTTKEQSENLLSTEDAKNSIAGSGGSGGGKSITMNLKIENHFVVDAAKSIDKDLDKIAKKVTQIIVTAGRDASVALGN